MTTPREEPHEMVAALPDEQWPAVVSDPRGRLTERASPACTTSVMKAWPPAWFGVAEGSTTDASERVEEIVSEGMGRRGA